MMTKLRRTLPAVAGLSLTVLLSGGCKKDKIPEFDADAKSGPDAKRSASVLIATNASATDDVNFDNQDQTDWKQVELKGKPGVLGVELHWDNANADLNCDVFNSLGEQIAASPGPSQGQQTKKLAVDIPSAGVYFIRVQAAKKGDFSVYTVSTHWEGDAAPACPAGQMMNPETSQCIPIPSAVDTTPKEHVKKPIVHHEGAPKPPKERKFDPDRGVQGRVVSSYREGASLVLHIDKGSSAGVKVGSKGVVLDGPSGANPLEGGSFEITQVIDESKSVGKATLKSIGRNIRVSINTGK